MKRIFSLLSGLLFLFVFPSVSFADTGSFTASNICFDSSTGNFSFDASNFSTLSGDTFVGLKMFSPADNTNFWIDRDSFSSPTHVSGSMTALNSPDNSDVEFVFFDLQGNSVYSQLFAYPTTPCNVPPVINQFNIQTLNEGGTYSTLGSFTNSDSTSWTGIVDYGDGSGSQVLTLSGTNFTLSHQYKNNGIYTVTVNVTDNQGATGTSTSTVTINNVAPTVGAIIVTTSPVQVNNLITASASFTDPGVLDTHTASWNWGDGNTTTGAISEANGSGSVSDAHTYTSTGVYPITLTVTDNNNASGTTTYQYVVVYDQSAGWVNGNKEFTSPGGVITGNTGATGKASFGFQVKYTNGSIVPSGKNVSLSFPTGNIDFASTSYRWLVINGSQATFKASGTLNGISGYTVLVSAIQGSGNASDLVRFQIKDSGGNLTYDTQPRAADTSAPITVVTKGKITIH